MNEAELLFKDLCRLYPNSSANLFPPMNEDGFWTIEIEYGGREICIEWSIADGFRISSASGFSFGERPDEKIKSYEEAIIKSSNYLKGFATSAPNYKLSLAQLRERRHFTQCDLATALNVKQPTVSGMERRGDIYISSLCRYVGSMGGVVAVKAIFPDAQYNLRFDIGNIESNLAYDGVIERQNIKPSSRDEILKTQFEALHATGTLAHANNIARAIKNRGSILELVP